MIRLHLFPRDLWKRCSPRTSKTVLGTLRFARVPRTVFEVLGLHLFQDPSEKGGVLAQYPSEREVVTTVNGHPVVQDLPYALSRHLVRRKV